MGHVSFRIGHLSSLNFLPAGWLSLAGPDSDPDLDESDSSLDELVSAS